MSKTKLVFLLIFCCTVGMSYSTTRPIDVTPSDRNLLPNPGFEYGFAEWQKEGPVIDSSTYFSGLNSCRINADPGNAWNTLRSANIITGVPNQGFRVDFYVKDTLTGGKCYFGLRSIRIVNNTESTISYYWHKIEHNPEWNRQEWTFMPFDGAQRVELYFWLDQYSAGSVWVDDVILTSDNLAANPGFEQNDGSWNLGDNMIDTMTARSGFSSAKLTGTSSKFNVISSNEPADACPNQEFVISAFTWDDLASGSFKIGIGFLDAAGSTISYSWFPVTHESSWKQTLGEAVSPPGTNSVQAYFWLSQGAAGNVWVDDVTLESQNLQRNPGFENGTSEWTLREHCLIDTGTSYRGAKSCRISGAPGDKWNSFNTERMIEVEDTKYYKVQCVAKSSLTAGQFKMGIRFLRFDETTLDCHWYTVPVTGSWAEYNTAFAAPAGTFGIQAYFLLSPDAQGAVWVDDARLARVDDIFVFRLTEKEMWSDESKVIATFDVHPFRGTLSDYRVKLERYNLGVTTPVFTKEYQALSSTFTESFPLAELPLGYSIYKAYLIRTADKALYDTETQYVQKVERLVYPALPPTKNVSIDVNHGFLLNGERFMPRMMWHAESGTELENSKARGINIIQVRKPETLDALKKLGLKGIMELYTNISVVDLEYIEKTVIAHKDNPALFGWLLNDEPSSHGVSPATLNAAYEKIKSLDPNHPVTFVDDKREYLRSHSYKCDFVSTDPYPVPQHSIAQVIDYTDDAATAKKPVNTVAQSFGLYGEWPLYPLPGELRAMVYLHLDHGATSMSFYCFNDKPQWYLSDHPDIWAAYKVLNQELEILKDVIASAETSNNVLVDNPNIDIKVRRYDGTCYLFAVNKSNQELQARFSGVGLIGKSAAEPIYEYRSKAIENGSFSDAFSPFMVHVYKMTPADR